MKTIPFAALPLIACALAARSEFVLSEGESTSLKAGVDLRIRQEVYDCIPYGGVMGNGGPSPYANWIRFRSRAWMRASWENVSIYARLANEFRWYPTGDSGSANTENWVFPDELYLDNLYLDVTDIFGVLDLRFGRQDFFGPDGYGSGRVLCEGSSYDGSRSLYFDAVRARLHVSEKDTLDFLGIYSCPRETLRVGENESNPARPERPRVRNSIAPGSTELVESGVGLYFQSRSSESLPFDLYWVFKRESHAYSRTGAKLTGRNVHTFGTLLRPAFSENLSGEFEFAWQVGEKDSGASVRGCMAYAGLTARPSPDSSVNPWLTLSCYYLSGERDGSGGTSANGASDHGWDPLWARWPQFSELGVYLFEYGIGYWSNIVHPALAAGCTIGGRAKFNAETGPLYAAVDDGLGGGDGNYIGWLTSARLTVPVTKSRDGLVPAVNAHVLGEVLTRGDYFASDRTAYFLRWEVSMAF